MVDRLYKLLRQLEASQPFTVAYSHDIAPSPQNRSTLSKTPQIDLPTAITFSHDRMDKINRLFLELQQSDDPKILKLAELKKHLKPNISLKTLEDILIPFERLLDRSCEDLNITTADQIKSTQKFPIWFALENLRSAFNVGSIFRTADAIGCEKIILSGYTPLPDRKQVQTSALGSADHVPWLQIADIDQMQLPTNFELIGVETTGASKNLDQFRFQKPCCFVFGNERFGLNKNTLAKCDHLLSIDMNGFKNSLNVAVTAGVIGFEWRRQWLLKLQQ